MNALPYIPGTQNENPSPLARFLPLLEAGVSTTWFEENLTANAWVLDPFGGSPQQALCLARSGARVLVAANNPITRFLLEMAADPPSESDFNAALAELAASRKGDERLESHLKKLYESECANCKKMLMVDAFLWHKDAEVPFARIYTCPHCGDAGERPTTLADAERASSLLASDKLHRARVLERVAPLNDPDREYAEEALHAYLPRALYVLTMLINRLDSLSLSPPRQRALEALLLTVCNAANTLYPHPVERPRPKRLIVPGQFYEHNLWKTLEEGIALWVNQAAPTPLTLFPEIPPESGGICIFEGKLKDLAESEKMPKFDASITAIPRPNQAFWTLSALWAGWLWGREAAEPFKVGLRRQRYDWGWHAGALQAAFHHLGALLPLKTPVFALLAEPEPSFLSAATIAAASAFQLKNIAMRTKHDPIQILWERADGGKKEKLDVESAVYEDLHTRGETATYLHLHTQALSGFARAQNLLLSQETADEALSRIHANIEDALRNNPNLTCYDGSEKNIQIGLWGFANQEDDTVPLADRVEMAVVRYLSHNPKKTIFEIEREIYPQFTGLETPSKALVAAILESYADRADNGMWSLRPKDAPSVRHADLDEMRALLTDIGMRLGYTMHQVNDKTLLWGDKADPDYYFQLIASALVHEFFIQTRWAHEKSIIIIPGGRAGLLAYKEKRDPALHALAERWHFIKFRLLRSLGEIPIITKETWDEQIGGDPIEGRSQSQLMMF
ncbi:MAG: hypothetical protein HN855_01545 [Anaerolineae bacterium]|jgi:hypothetical protein|nr:hypothetical protein [Anaerolineae bacterium]MBT7072775.1 hypothetical protein [Anaerolineae bacterium]MBT7323824.1 hypothetical protein [Anaerolineae bacterium]